MHKVDSPGATGGNEWTNGDAGTGVPRTRLEAKYMNTVQRELVALIEYCGIALSDANDQQLAERVIITLPNIAALRDAPITGINKTVIMFVRGQATDGDGNGAFYRWVNASTTAHDGGAVVSPIGAPAAGRWLRTNLGIDSSGLTLAWTSVTGKPTEFPPSAHTHVVADVTGAAPLASPALTGTPTAPTAAGGTNTTQIATTAFTRAEIAALVASSPSALDTLNELATALGNDPAFATTMVTALALKAPLASPALTGTPTAPTAAGGTNTTQVATTAFARALVQGIWSNGGFGLPLLTLSASAPPAAGTAGRIHMRY